jgi:hypothetical protein
VELTVAINAGGLVAEIGTEQIHAGLVAELGRGFGGIGVMGYGVVLVADGDGSEDPAKDLLDFGLLDEFEAAAAELGLPEWPAPDGRSVTTGPARDGERPPWSSVCIALAAQGPADGKHVDVGRVLWLADRLGGDALLTYGARFSASRDLRLDGSILDERWCDELRGAFSNMVGQLGLLAWPIDSIRIEPANERPAGWAEERRYRRWPPATASPPGRR